MFFERGVKDIVEAQNIALTQPEAGELSGDINRERHLRMLGEASVGETIKYLYEQQFENKIGISNMAMVDVIKLLHISAAPGGIESEIPGEQVKLGEFRNMLVIFGDKVAPLNKDIPHLMSMFGGRLNTLIEECKPEDADKLASWAYAVMTGIHPFENGNGRTGRSLVEYVRYSVARKNDVAYTPLHLSRVEEKAGDILSTELSNLQYSLGLYETKYDPKTGVSSAEIAYAKNPAGYFDRLRERIQSVITKTDTMDKLKESNGLVKISESITHIGQWKNYETKSLIAESLAKKFRDKLEGARGQMRELSSTLSRSKA